jgi:mannose-6-phosphate isomerase
MNWYPIKFSTHIRSYSFGGSGIKHRLLKANLPDGIVAETWEISDYKDTAGTVANGSLSGTAMHDLVQKFPDELVGKGWSGPHFPLLEKFLDAAHMLPVHLHADDETARCKYCEPNGKTESWHIVWAETGATILLGVKPGHSRQSLFNAFKAQAYDDVVPRFPIKTGDTIYVPAGVLHSFGPGTIVFEVQQTSDLAQTVMPTDLYGGRHTEEQWEQNINAVLDELRPEFNPKPNPGLLKKSNDNQYLVGSAGPYFVLERWTLSGVHKEPSHENRCMTISSVQGSVAINYGSGGTEKLEQGNSCLVPAAIGDYQIVPEREAVLMVCYVPDLDIDVRKPLRDAGHTTADIKLLGEI